MVTSKLGLFLFIQTLSWPNRRGLRQCSMPDRTIGQTFPPTYKLRPNCNRSTIKISYSCIPNMASIIKPHNVKIVKPATEERNPTSEKTAIVGIQPIALSTESI